MILVFLIANFTSQYRNFLDSPQKDSLFEILTRRAADITAYAQNPVILWFWRTNSDDPKIDSLIEKIPFERNAYLSGVLRWEAIEAETYETAWNKLQLALHFDSVAIENFLSLAALSIKNKKIGRLLDLFSLPVYRDLRNQVFFFANVQILILIGIFISLLTYIIVKTAFYLPVISHRLDPLHHNFLKGLIPFLILIIPALVFRNLYFIFIAYGLLLLVILNDREKSWLRIGLATFLVASLLGFSLNYFIPFLRGTSKTYRLYQMVNYDNEYRIDAKNDFERELLALALKKQDAIDEALTLYEELYYGGHRDLSVVNNLANIYFLYDEDARAEELYKTTLHHNRGEPYFNLGLLKQKNLEYLASSEFMEQARALGYSAILQTPVDIAPKIGEFYRSMLPFGPAALRQRVSMLAIMTLVLFVLSFVPFRLPPPYFCGSCGQAICAKCREEGGDPVICRDCAAKIQSVKDSENAETLAFSLGRNKRLIDAIFTYAASVLLPGSGLIYQGRNFIGGLIVFFSALAYTPLLFPKLLVLPAGWICLPLLPVTLAVAAVILFFAHLFSFVLLRGRASHAA